MYGDTDYSRESAPGDAAAASQIWGCHSAEGLLNADCLLHVGNASGKDAASPAMMTELTAEQWKTIEDGIAFYKAAAPVIKAGQVLPGLVRSS